MAEIKNTFIKSKMNTDLDDRLIPNGEYTGATNIAVSKSEGQDVGALESIVGNAEVAGKSLFTSDFEIIGYYSDETSNTVITFVTNYTDPDPSTPTSIAKANAQGGNWESHICIFDPTLGSYTKVVSGDFLNFSKTQETRLSSIFTRSPKIYENLDPDTSAAFSTSMRFRLSPISR